MTSLSSPSRVPGDRGLRADGGQGALQGEQVPHAVVDDGDHYSTPLVEGISWENRWSMADASARDRARDLNIPSMMW